MSDLVLIEEKVTFILEEETIAVSFSEEIITAEIVEEIIEVPFIEEVLNITLSEEAITVQTDSLAIAGPPGKSPYELAVLHGFDGTEVAWLASLKGADSVVPGPPGPSAYEDAVSSGFVGTEAEWLASLKGADGASAYELAVAAGFSGTEEEWRTSLRGEPGPGGGVEVGTFGGTPVAIAKIVFNGSTETVTIQGDTAFINMPLYTYSHFNASDGNNACTPSLTGPSSWYVATPTSEGVPYKIGNWTGGTLQSCTNTTVSISTSNKARELSNQIFKVEVFDANDTSLLASNQLTITGNTSNTTSGITLTVSGWIADYDQFAGSLSVTVNPATILGSGKSGRIRVKVTVGSCTPFFPSPFFFDHNPSACTVTTPTIQETSGQVVTKFLSGVEMYTTNSKFTVNLPAINTPNANTYRGSNIVEIRGTEYGLSQINLSPGSLTGWTSSYSTTGCSYTYTAWSITSSNYFYMASTANIDARGQDPWTSQSYVVGADSSIIINTYGNASTSSYEGFQDEVWRLPVGNYDTPLGTTAADWQNRWTSSSDLTINDLQCWYSSGWRLYYPRTNYVGYAPNGAQQPNYSSASGRRYFYRAFYHNTSNSVSGSLRLHGMTKAQLGRVNQNGIRVEIKVPGKTGWMDLGNGFNSGQYNGSDGDGIWQNSSAQANDWFDFGWKSQDALDSSCGWVVVVRISSASISDNLPTAMTIEWDIQEHA